jgi:choline kinase
VKGIVIAAGAGVRMGALTEAIPKCLLPVAGRPLIDWTIERLRAAGCSEIVVIVGYRGELVRPAGATIVENGQYTQNNILHSLMTARAHFDGPLMVSYSDIWVEPEIHQRLAAAPGDIVIAADTDWRAYYEGRTQHPLGEAEKVHLDRDGRAHRFGKHLAETADDGLHCAEFLGLWRMSARGAARFRDVFLELEGKLEPGMRFQHAAAWQKAYITDLLQELADRGDEVRCAAVERGWAELDTREDYERLDRIAARQRLRLAAEKARA